jgi:predicted ester cyclase
MSIEENKDLVNLYNKEIWNKGNFSLVDDIFYSEFTFNYPDPDLTPDLGGFKQTVDRFRKAFPDMEFTSLLMVAEGDIVVYRWKGIGTHKADYMGIAPTDKRVEFTGITIHKISNGKILEEFTQSDIFGLMQQIGPTS